MHRLNIQHHCSFFIFMLSYPLCSHVDTSSWCIDCRSISDELWQRYNIRKRIRRGIDLCLKIEKLNSIRWFSRLDDHPTLHLRFKIIRKLKKLCKIISKRAYLPYPFLPQMKPHARFATVQNEITTGFSLFLYFEIVPEAAKPKIREFIVTRKPSS